MLQLLYSQFLLAAFAGAPQWALRRNKSFLESPGQSPILSPTFLFRLWLFLPFAMPEQVVAKWNSALLHDFCCFALLWLCVRTHGFVQLCLSYGFIRALKCASPITNLYNLPKPHPTCSQWESSSLRSASLCTQRLFYWRSITLLVS